MRPLTPLPALVVLAIAARADERPPAGPRPDPPRSFLDAPPPGATHAFFVRVTGAALGGNFDALGHEEVQFRAITGGRDVELTRRTIDLSSVDAKQVALSRTAWIEVPPPPLELSLDARDVDLTEYEPITATTGPLRLTPASFGAAPTRLVARTSDIVCDEWGVLVPRKKVTIPGASIELSLVSAPRRDAIDAESIAAVRAAFAPLLAEPADVTPGNAVALAARLEAAHTGAMADVGQSLHTRIRKAVPALASTAAHLARDARSLGAAEPAALRARLRALRGDPALDAIIDDVDAGLPATVAVLLEWERRAEALRKERGRDASKEQQQRLREVRGALFDARVGLGKLTRANEVWTELRRGIDAELRR